KLVHPLRNHPCAVELLDRMAEPPLFGEAKFDPLLQLFGRLAADTQFYEMKGHGPRFAQMRVWVNAALVNNRAEIRNGGGGTARNRSAAESAFHHVDGKAPEARLLVALVHVETGLPHGLDGGVEGD